MELVVEARGRRIEVGRLPPGDHGVAATVAGMQAVIDHAATAIAPRLAALARQLSSRHGPRAFGSALFEWLRRHVRFRRDPSQVELLRHPADLLDSIESTGEAACDCDDLACLGCAVVHAAGLRPVLVTVGRVSGGRFEHVFCALRLADRLSRDTCYALDPQEASEPGEWPKHARAKLWGLRITGLSHGTD